MKRRRAVHLVAVLRPVGMLTAGLGLFMLASAVVGLLMGSREGGRHMAISAVLAEAVAGVLVFAGHRARDSDLRRSEAMVVVVATWVLAGIVGGIPFVVGAGLSPVDAFFETVSGFTNTGASILPEVTERLDPALHFWRLLTHWLGGMGIVVLFVAVFPTLGVGARHLFQVESPGPRSEGLTPRIRETSAVLWRIYVAITVVLVLLLVLVGLSPFEAVGHAFSTMGTGGFSTRNQSIAGFHNPAAEWVITVFMLVAGVNFGLYHKALKRGPRALLRDPEARCYLAIFAVSAMFCTFLILPSRHGLGEASRLGAFQVASLMTSTGFSTDDFERWPTLARLVLVVLYFVGGSSGSTAGGMKVIRVLTVFKTILAEVRRSFRPHLVAPVRVGRKAVSGEAVTEAFTNCTMFASTVVLGAALVALLDGVDLTTSFMSSLACVGTVGPGLGLVGPTDDYAFFSSGSKLVLSACMILGRLEFMAVLALFAPGFWRR